MFNPPWSVPRLALVGFLCVIAFILFDLATPPFSIVNARKLSTGMTQNEVRRLLGSPTKETQRFWSYNDDSKAWFLRYGGWLDVQFDNTGVVTHIDIEW